MYQKVNLEGRFDNALTIIHIVAGFMCGDLASLEYDPTIRPNHDGTIGTIDVVDESGTITRRGWNHWALYPCLAGSSNRRRS
jgi:hypothetical protein